MKIMRTIVQEDQLFLPEEVKELLSAMVSLRFKFNDLARRNAVPRIKPNSDFTELIAEVYPNNPVHTMENVYRADKEKDSNEDGGCNKDYNECPTITGGLTHITCMHNITKGFTALHRGESPLLVLGPAMRRLPQRVQAAKRVFLYDNACKAHKSALRRFPYRVRNWLFAVDRKHWPNHTACSDSYNIDEYPFLSNMNSQISEQLNMSLRKLSTILAYSEWENHLKTLEMFFVTKNLKVKGILK